MNIKWKINGEDYKIKDDELVIKVVLELLNLYNISRMKKNHILGILFFLCLFSSTLCQNPEPTQTNLELNKLLNVTNLPNGFTYYAVNFELTKSDLKLFLITVKTDQVDTVEIFTSIYYEGVDKYFKYPNWENNTQACSYSSIDTCAVVLPDIK